jgi:cell volume regulation protein A
MEIDINEILLIFAVIVFLGYLAEWVFRKIHVPDTLLLILVGFAMGPLGLGIDPERLGQVAPLFTTFTLLFLMFDGALSIDLRSLADSIGFGISIGFFNFFASSLAISAVFLFLVSDIVTALMLGFALGGISSAYVIPILKQITVDKKVYSVLTLESALTDVLAIVFAITMMELKILNAIELKSVFSQIASLFFVAGVMGILAGSLWIYLENKLMEKDTNYMMTIAYVVLLYFLTEFLGGNGAIAAMCFGIVITNANLLIDLSRRVRGKKKKTPAGEDEKPGKKITIVSRREKMFYQEISFLIKTIFFVYIGLLLNVESFKVVAVGTGIAIAVLLLRNLTSMLTKKFKALDRMLINSLFARGIAPAAIILMAKTKNLTLPQEIIDIVYFAITATIILSSGRIFLYKRKSQS